MKPQKAMPKHPVVMRALVTGGTGFIGRAIVRRLIDCSFEVRVVTRSAARCHGAFGDGVTALEHDLRRGALPASAASGCDVVIHSAGMPRPATVRTLEILHVEGVRAALTAARDAGVPRFIHIASDTVVFNGSPLVDIDESYEYPERYLDDYSRTKAGGERLVLEWARRGDIEAVSLRPSLVWGPDDTTFLPILQRMARTPVGMPLAGKADVLDETTYIDNLVDAVIAALTKPMTGRPYFITDAYGMRCKSFFSAMLEAISVRPRFLHVPAAIATSGAWVADNAARLCGLPTPLAQFGAHRTLVDRRYRIDAAARDLDWRPAVDLETGLARLREWSQRDGGFGNGRSGLQH